MKKLAVSLGRVLFVLLLLVGLSVCTLSDQTESPPPEGALSFDQLLANLDELQGPAMQSPSVPGKSVFSLPDGSLFGSADLSAYINAIKKDLAGYIYSCTGGRPYLVTAKKLAWGTESGLMWVPVTWWGKWIPRPIISYQHGTQVYRECAPSKFNANPLAILWAADLTGALQNYVECIVGALMATAGYTVVMPDYTGFGSSTAIHPYVHLSLGQSVVGAIDEARARFTARGLTPSSELYLTGYSEGGYTTMAGARALVRAGKSVTGIVACAGPYDLSGTMRLQMLSADEIPAPHYLPYTASGYRAAEPTMPDLSLLLAGDWDDVAFEYFDGTHTNAEVSEAVPADTTPNSMLTDKAINDYLKAPGGSVYQLLESNNAWQGWLPTCPIAFVHCEDDDVVPDENAIVAQTYYAALGIPVPILPATPIAFIESVMGTTHIAAYPSAMLTAFSLIRGDY